MAEKPRNSAESRETPPRFLVDFMLAEYNGIGKTFGDLHTVVLRMINYFLLLAAVPISFVSLFVKVTKDEIIDINHLPPLVVVLFLLIAASGCIFAIMLINLRMQQILYARTINLIRGFFTDHSKQFVDLQPYLTLPTTDERPDFLEKGRFFFWQVSLMGLIDGAYLCLGLKNTHVLGFVGCDGWQWMISVVLGTLFSGLHVLLYVWIAGRHRAAFHKKHPLTEENAGNV